MHDIVAAKVTDRHGKRYGFMTWGRIVDPVEDGWVKEIVGQFARTCAIEGVAEVIVCLSLHEVMSCQYFHEALFDFANAGIPHGDAYESWRQERLDDFQNGQLKIHSLGSDLSQV